MSWIGAGEGFERDAGSCEVNAKREFIKRSPDSIAQESQARLVKSTRPGRSCYPGPSTRGLSYWGVWAIELDGQSSGGAVADRNNGLAHLVGVAGMAPISVAEPKGSIY